MRDFSFGDIAGVCLFVIATLLAPYGSASAATLVLKDGAVIHGEIETLQDDVYTVKTDSLGTVRVRKQDVRTIDHSVRSTVDSSVGSPTNESCGGRIHNQAAIGNWYRPRQQDFQR